MAEITKLRQPPIKEALIDMRVDRRPELSADDIEAAADRLRELYPKCSRIQLNQFNFKLEPEQAPVTNIASSHNGYRFASSDDKKITQFQLDGFTFNWLEPYESWECLYERAHEAWAVYAEVTAPRAITRIGVRYINKLGLPQPVNDFGEYLTSPPNIPEGLPQTVKSFLSRVVMHDSQLGADCILTQAMEAVDLEHDQVPVVLDIDTFIQKRFELTEDPWIQASHLRDLKNRIFFKSITDTALEPYK